MSLIFLILPVGWIEKLSIKAMCNKVNIVMRDGAFGLRSVPLVLNDKMKLTTSVCTDIMLSK